MSWKSTRKLNWACIAFTVSVLACTVLIVLCAFEKREGMCCLCTVGAGFSLFGIAATLGGPGGNPALRPPERREQATFFSNARRA